MTLTVMFAYAIYVFSNIAVLTHFLGTHSAVFHHQLEALLAFLSAVCGIDFAFPFTIISQISCGTSIM